MAVRGLQLPLSTSGDLRWLDDLACLGELNGERLKAFVPTVPSSACTAPMAREKWHAVIQKSGAKFACFDAVWRQ